MTNRNHIPDDVTFTQEFRSIAFGPNGERVDGLDSAWLNDEDLVRSWLNFEYPEPSASGYKYVMQTRWTSEVRTWH